jgi:hypothetical protein
MAGTEVKYDEAIIQEIRARAVDGSQAMPFGGLEIGGVLFGMRTPEHILVQAWRRIPCEHSKGPGLQLSAHDEEGLKALLADSAQDSSLAGMERLGWFRSTRRQMPHLSPEDVALHQRYFPEVWQVVLVMKPKVFGPSPVAVFRRGAEGTLGEQSKPVQELEIESRGLVPAPRAADDSPVRRSRQPPAVEVQAPEAPSLRVAVAPAESSFVPTFASVGSTRRIPLWVLGGILLLVVAATAGAFYWFQFMTPRPIPLQIAAQGTNILLSWNPETAAIRAATAGRLEIHEGAAQRTIPLDRAALAGAHATYASGAFGDITVKLALDTPDGVIEQSAQYIGGGRAEEMKQQVEQLTAERDGLKEEVRKVTERAIFAERQLILFRQNRAALSGTRPSSVKAPPPAPVRRP